MGFDQNDGQFGWTAGAPFPVSQEMGAVDVTAVMYHEIAHSIGIYSNANMGVIEVAGLSPAIFRFDDAADKKSLNKSEMCIICAY